MPRLHILIIEDEAKMAHSLQQGLEEHDIRADVALLGAEGLKMALLNTYHVVISDVVLPDISGLHILQSLRDQGNTVPVLLLTALGELDDKALGFDAGADDYLVKPFEFRELLMRIRALTRRPAPSEKSEPQILRLADVEMHLDTRDFFRQGQRIELTPKEFALMAYFLRNPGRTISKKEISEQVWDIHFDTGTNVVEVYVNFLRKKVEKGFDKKLIHTQFKTGYIFREE
ncbi:MAG: response regulator transcription factor [Saprospiraceae bacterium]|nr:response regulator transcription factor [Saprospiraceae bacterium]